MSKGGEELVALVVISNQYQVAWKCSNGLLGRLLEYVQSRDSQKQVFADQLSIAQAYGHIELENLNSEQIQFLFSSLTALVPEIEHGIEKLNPSTEEFETETSVAQKFRELQALIERYCLTGGKL